MESWIHASKGKSQLFPEEMEYFSFDPISRSRKRIPDWDYNMDNQELISNGEAVERMGFMDWGFGDMKKGNLPCRPGVGTVSGESVSEICKEVGSPTRMGSSNSYLREEDCRPKLWRSDVEAGNREASLIDLKLGRLTDRKESQLNRVLKESSVVSAAGSSMPVKRARAAGTYPQAPFCQVLGCNKDLSSSKDYHKRHRVCDTHSKTPKVVVNGVEQRFCQQCSRFHLLAEFDDYKRSCRRRLAGHNERRRKPQFDTLSGRQHKLFAAYQGARFSGTSLPKGASLLFSNIVQGGNLSPGRTHLAYQSRHIKQANESFSRSHLEASLTRAQLLPESYLYCPEKQLNSRLPPLVTENHVVADTTLPVKELSLVSNSGCALSLLSSQSGNLSTQLARVAESNPSIILGSKLQHRVVQTSERVLATNSSEKYMPGELYSNTMNSLELDQLGSEFISDTSHRIDSKVYMDGVFQGSDHLESDYNLSPEHGLTVDLLQLSSHLQRVERQRNSIQIKPEADESCGFLGN